MRRLSLSVLAACAVALLSACSSGSGVTTGTSNVIDHVYFYNGSAQTNDFFVALSGGTGAPIQVNAEGVKGSGTQPLVVFGATFTWSAAYAPANTTYSVGSSPEGAHKCGAPTIEPAIPIFVQNQNHLTFSTLASGQVANTVFVGAVPGVEPLSPGTSYCYNLVATQPGSGIQGSVLVVVSNSP